MDNEITGSVTLKIYAENDKRWRHSNWRNNSTSQWSICGIRDTANMVDDKPEAHFMSIMV